jgi:hypothetical protein
MEAEVSPEMLVPIYQTTRRHTLEDRNLVRSHKMVWDVSHIPKYRPKIVNVIKSR